MGVDAVKGGSPYGATTISDGDGSRMPSTVELNGASYLGKRVASTARRLLS
jgi:NAD(P)H dehydrogenase (quinone)